MSHFEVVEGVALAFSVLPGPPVVDLILLFASARIAGIRQIGMFPLILTVLKWG